MKKKMRSLFLPLLACAFAAGLFGLQSNDAARVEEAAARPPSLTEQTVDPAEWGRHFPRQYEDHLRTSELTGTKYGGGGSGSPAANRLEENPRLKILYSGYVFSADYRARRGHAYMLSDQRETLRVKAPFSQSGGCLQCHASNVAVYRNQGIASGAPGTPDEPLTSRNGYDQLMRGFEKVGKMPFDEATKLVNHTLACIDCHDPKNMELRVTRPAFIQGIRALAASEATAAQFPSIEKWRGGNRAEPYDPNAMASRQEKRSFVCGQCHAEYFCNFETTLFYPWNNGLKANEIENYYNSYKFPDGRTFSDWKHENSGAEVLKAQHPEFELWSQGIHSRRGVSCADCHMQSRQEGENRISDHWIRSPLLGKMEACQDCHQSTAEEIRAEVQDIQERTHKMLRRAEDSVVELIRALADARAAGYEDRQLREAQEYQRGAQWRVDFVGSENSMGIHASGEAFRLLTEAMDLAARGRTAVHNIQLR
ncbi:MAG: ammonia-forming cytochrome c nitrite reductase subunit c552 [Acidobacteriota bacterium]|jgi:nitrite reductase (cytochrome c-552)|nr:ammonia-forming cytochrome c nitrite reductase subunit c552 [Acidobacteriota bacterium]